ncbi:MAG: histidine kinase [Clostridia bacterium]|nr:histidine kinase [Clostridia bacterium]
MSGWLESLAFFTCGAMTLLMALGLLLAVAMRGIDQWSKRFFIVLFTIQLVEMIAYVPMPILYNRPGFRLEIQITDYVSSLMPSALMPMLTVYLLHCWGVKWRDSRLFRVVVALWSLYFLALNVSQFTTLFYYYTPDNQLQRGAWYPLTVVPLVAMMILNLVVMNRRRDKLPPKLYFALLLYLLPLTIALIVHMFVSVYLLIFIGIVLCAFSMFGIILLDEQEQYMRQQREIARQRASITVLEMRPHFIYNTMTSIYYLCDQDPKKAQQVTLDFTTYLRKNFTAIASENTIPFSEELEHTRAYLAVEQAQFEDRLFVAYDTPHTQFRLPPLTLQPIVENAVKHGMDPDSDPLRISIRTRLTEKGSEIIVEDNGPGYEPAVDNEPHIALTNIRQRLALMCRGALTISPREGGGTTVRVTIP